MKRLSLVGAGGFARELYSIVQRAPAHGREWSIAGFLDDTPAALAPSVMVEDNSTVGIGAGVVRRVRSGTTAFDNPARPIG